MFRYNSDSEKFGELYGTEFLRSVLSWDSKDMILRSDKWNNAIHVGNSIDDQSRIGDRRS